MASDKGPKNNTKNNKRSRDTYFAKELEGLEESFNKCKVIDTSNSKRAKRRLSQLEKFSHPEEEDDPNYLILEYKKERCETLVQKLYLAVRTKLLKDKDFSFNKLDLFILNNRKKLVQITDVILDLELIDNSELAKYAALEYLGPIPPLDDFHKVNIILYDKLTREYDTQKKKEIMKLIRFITIEKKKLLKLNSLYKSKKKD